MPLHSDPLTPRREFCLALQAMRERKGITLAQIAGVTKVPADLFAAFERGDLRRWPKGLFRRAFFRGYAGMIGVRVDEACDTFARLFPDQEMAEPAHADVERSDENSARLTLDASWHGPRAAAVVRLVAAVVDACAVIALAGAAEWIAGVSWSTAIAIVALTYYSVASVLVSSSPAGWAIARRQHIWTGVMRIGGSIRPPLRSATARRRPRTRDYSAA